MAPAAGAHEPDAPRPPEHGRPRSFARTGGRMSAAEARALDSHGARFLLGADAQGRVITLHPPRVPLVGVFSDDAAPLALEIGCGMGDQAVSFAARNPGWNVLAVEVWRAGLASTIRRAAAAGVGNLRAIQADAASLLATGLPAGVATEVWTFFPDPWPKSRHHKRRLVSAEFADAVARVLVPGGVWRLATDWEHYAHQMYDVLDGAAQFVADPQADAGGFSPRWEGRVPTRYERRAHAAGRQVWDLAAFRR